MESVSTRSRIRCRKSGSPTASKAASAGPDQRTCHSLTAVAPPYHLLGNAEVPTPQVFERSLQLIAQTGTAFKFCVEVQLSGSRLSGRTQGTLDEPSVFLRQTPTQLLQTIIW